MEKLIKTFLPDRHYHNDLRFINYCIRYVSVWGYVNTTTTGFTPLCMKCTLIAGKVGEQADRHILLFLIILA